MDTRDVGPDELAAFFSKVVPGQPWDCWIGNAARDTNGYCQVGVNLKRWQLHRLSHELFIGPIPEGLDVDHLCFVRACANPYHLEAVTRLENMRRSHARRDRVRDFSSPVCKHGHPWKPETTIWTKDGGRACRVCHRERARRYERRKREERVAS